MQPPLDSKISISLFLSKVYRVWFLRYSKSMNLYKETLTDHYRNPRNKKALSREDFASTVHNPSCGDSISWQGCVVNGKIVALAFEGKGCVISQGTASMLSEAVMHTSLSDCMSLQASFICSLIGLELGPTRLRCALLPLEALQQGIHAYQQADIIEKRKKNNA